MTPATKPPAGYFISRESAEALHAYLMTRPCDETFDLVCALRASKPLEREPK